MIVRVILFHEYCCFQCWRHEHSPYHRMLFAVVCCIHWKLFLSLSHLIIHPVQKMIWILTTNPILFRHLQWWIAVFLLLLEGKQRGSPFYRDFLFPKWRACVHERNVMNLVWPCPMASKQRVSPFFHPTIHQLSTLEKTNLCHRPILSSLLSTSFQQIDGGGMARNMCHGQQRIPRFFNIPLLVYSKNFDFHNFFSPSFLMQKMTELREPLQSDSSVVLTSLWLFLHMILFVFFTISLKNNLWNWNGWCWTKRKDGSTHHMWIFPWPRCLRVGFLVSMYLIWISGSKLIRSNNQSKATLWVLGTCLIVGFLPL